jgi:hypothetical protein
MVFGFSQNIINRFDGVVSGRFSCCKGFAWRGHARTRIFDRVGSNLVAKDALRSKRRLLFPLGFIQGQTAGQSRELVANQVFHHRIISDKIASNAVEDARPRMATPSEPITATEPTAFDTLEAIDDILREAEHHV